MEELRKKLLEKKTYEKFQNHIKSGKGLKGTCSTCCPQG